MIWEFLMKWWPMTILEDRERSGRVEEWKDGRMEEWKGKTLIEDLGNCASGMIQLNYIFSRVSCWQNFLSN